MTRLLHVRYLFLPNLQSKSKLKCATVWIAQFTFSFPSNSVQNIKHFKQYKIEIACPFTTDPAPVFKRYQILFKKSI